MSANPSSAKRLWYASSTGKFVGCVLLLQAILYLSQHFQWFPFNHHKGYTVLIAVVATAAAIGLLFACCAVGWLFKWKCQFTLTTLLLIFPVMAIPCGWFAREMEFARQQRHFNDYVESNGGSFMYEDDSHNCWGPPIRNRSYDQWPRSLVGREFLADVIELDLWEPSNTDIQQLRNFAQLKSLSLRGDQVTNASLAQLSHLVVLSSLSLSGPQITDSGLSELKAFSDLRYLDLEDTNISDAGLRHLTRFKELHSLNLTNTQISDAGLEDLKGFHQLWTLHLAGTSITDAGLEHLKGLTHLEFIDVTKTQITAEGILLLKQALPDTSFLD